MSSVLTRNLRSMKILQKHNFSEEEAQEVLDTLQGVSATKDDINRIESKLSRDLLKTETRLEKQISLVREDLSKTREDTIKIESSLKNEILNNKIEITSVKNELKEEIHLLDKKIDQVAFTLKDEIYKSSSSQLKWIFGMLFTILIAIVGLLKL